MVRPGHAAGGERAAVRRAGVRRPGLARAATSTIPSVLVERAELALDRARRFGDVDLEVKALADGGLAHVQAGRVAEGMAMLDEAMALATRRGHRPTPW